MRFAGPLNISSSKPYTSPVGTQVVLQVCTQIGRQLIRTLSEVISVPEIVSWKRFKLLQAILTFCLFPMRHKGKAYGFLFFSISCDFYIIVHICSIEVTIFYFHLGLEYTSFIISPFWNNSDFWLAELWIDFSGDSKEIGDRNKKRSLKKDIWRLSVTWECEVVICLVDVT